MSLTQFFAYAQLPPHLREVSKPFAEAMRDLSVESLQRLSAHLAETLPHNEEGEEALGRLADAVRLLGATEPFKARVPRLVLEAKDCVVRAHLFKEGEFEIDAEGKAVLKESAPCAS